MVAPLVTVVTSTLNAVQTLERAIQSVREQDYPLIEYVVIDGGSTDGTVELISRNDSSIDVWVSEPDRGIYDAWNKALGRASGEWICFLGADDYFADKSALSRLVDGAMAAPPGSLVVYSRIRVVNPDGGTHYETGRSWTQSAKQFRQTMNIPHPGLLHNRELFERYGCFDPSFRIAGDYELLLRYLKDNSAIFVDGPPVIAMRSDGISGSPAGSVNALLEIRQAQRRHGIRIPGRGWLLAIFKVYVRRLVSRLAGERTAQSIGNFLRRTR